MEWPCIRITNLRSIKNAIVEKITKKSPTATYCPSTVAELTVALEAAKKREQDNAMAKAQLYQQKQSDYKQRRFYQVWKRAPAELSNEAEITALRSMTSSLEEQAIEALEVSRQATLKLAEATKKSDALIATLNEKNKGAAQRHKIALDINKSRNFWQRAVPVPNLVTDGERKALEQILKEEEKARAVQKQAAADALAATKAAEQSKLKLSNLFGLLKGGSRHKRSKRRSIKRSKRRSTRRLSRRRHRSHSRRSKRQY